MEEIDADICEKAVAELKQVPWEFAFVSRRDASKTVTGACGGSRDVMITSARGVRQYSIQDHLV